MLWNRSIRKEANRIAGILADLPEYLSVEEFESVYRAEIEKLPANLQEDIRSVAALQLVRKPKKQVTVMKQDNRVTVIGNVTNSQVGQSLKNCSLMIQQQASGEPKALLDQLQNTVAALIEKLPDDKKGKAGGVVENLEMVVKQATSAEPKREWYSLSAKGLLEAASWVNDFSGEILSTVGKLGALLWPDFSIKELDAGRS